MEVKQILPPKIQKLWNAIELRFLVVVSLLLQIVLIATGSRRKYSRNRLLAAVLWFSYLSADSIATLALGVISQTGGDSKNKLDPKSTITVFWAPFLLMHLGGPDTITAYALADNELWSRHLLGLIGQVFVATYVYLRSFSAEDLNLLWIVVFCSGMVKYLERSWVLYSASKDQFRDSVVSAPDPGPNYARFMDELVSREKEGFIVSLGKAIDNISSTSSTANNVTAPRDNDEAEDPDRRILQEAYSFFGTFRKLFADLILSFQDREISVSVFKKLNWKEAFGIVEIELGFVFDLFYTKSPLVFSGTGIWLRMFSCLSTVGALIGFIIIKKNGYPENEVVITYLLLVGAISLEFYAVLILFQSDRMAIWLGLDRALPPETGLHKRASLLQRLRILPARERWSNLVGQYNVLEHCIKYMPKHRKVCWCRKKFDQYVEKLRQFGDRYLFWRNEPVPADLKKLFFDELKRRVEGGGKKYESVWYDKILFEEMKRLDQKNGLDSENEDEVEFDQSILIWQIATDICYNRVEQQRLELEVKTKREGCRLLSNYMVHLLMVSPSMLPSGIGPIRFQDTCAEATEFFNFEKNLKKGDACDKLSIVDARFRPSEVKGDRSKSLLFDGCRLAQSLNDLDAIERWDRISEAWLHMLIFAAGQCSWSDHAEKLSQGGELLTHVWLLMAHFGLTDQFQIAQGYIRAKLELK